ncbi:MAG: hypothetical protein QM831_36295 [Kofleriaceae bacterium]
MRALVVVMLLAHSVIADPACDRFMPMPNDRSPLAFSNALSFISCNKDVAVPRIAKLDDIDPAIDALVDSFTPTIALYMQLMRIAPDAMQIQIAFAVGLTYEDLIVRARAAVVDPMDTILRDALAARLDAYIAAAMEIFDAIDRVTTADPTMCLTTQDHELVQRARRLREELSTSRIPR